MMKIMIRAKALSVAVAAVFIVAGCGADDAPVATDSEAVDKASVQAAAKPKAPPDEFDGRVVKPHAPYSIAYKVIGTPVVGSPVTIQLQVDSAIGASSTLLEFRNRDSSALVLGESQPSRVSIEAPTDGSEMKQQITVVPLREGRLFVNVTATVQTARGIDSTTIAVPIQVGEGGRELIEQGRLETTESGETVRVLPGN